MASGEAGGVGNSLFVVAVDTCGAGSSSDAGFEAAGPLPKTRVRRSWDWGCCLLAPSSALGTPKASPCLSSTSMLNVHMTVDAAGCVNLSSAEGEDRDVVSLGHARCAALVTSLTSLALSDPQLTPCCFLPQQRMPCPRSRPVISFKRESMLLEKTTRFALTHKNARAHQQRRFPCPRIAAVGIVVAKLPSGKRGVLFTRRASHMRTFPGAWVLPGGSCDKGEHPRETAAREVFEETSIVCDAVGEPIGAWESCFPTFRASAEVPLKAHILMIVYVCSARGSQIATEEGEGHRAETASKSGAAAASTDLPPVKLQESECDAYAWLSETELRRIVDSNADGAVKGEGQREKRGGQDEMRLCDIKGAIRPLTLEDIGNGVYPNAKGVGMPQGHDFVVRALLRRWEEGKGGKL